MSEQSARPVFAFAQLSMAARTAGLGWVVAGPAELVAAVVAGGPNRLRRGGHQPRRPVDQVSTIFQ